MNNAQENKQEKSEMTFKKYLHKRNISYQILSDKTKISKNSISRAIKGKGITVKTVLKIAEGLNEPPEKIFKLILDGIEQERSV